MASNFFNKVLYFMGIGEGNEDQAQQEPQANTKPHLEPAVTAATPIKKNNVVNIHSATTPMRVVLMEPTAYDEVQDICDNLKSKKPIIINFENIDKELAKRMVDFISGSVYALDGTIQKVSNGIVLVAPSNVDILGSIKGGLTNEEFDVDSIFSWLNK